MTWPTKDDFVDGDVLTAAQVNNIGTNLNEIDPTGITDGYVVTADGAGGLGWEAVVAGAYTLITSGTISSATTTDITGITQDYKHLEVWLYDINISGNNDIRIDMFDGTFPGSSGYQVYSSIQASSTTVSSGGSQGAAGFVRLFDFGTIGSGYLRNFFRARFYDYASTSVVNKFGEGFGSYQTTSGANQVSLYSTANLKQDSAIGLSTVRIVGGNSITAASYKIWGIN